MALNNNQIYTLVNQAYTATLGGAALTAENLASFVDKGDITGAIAAEKEQFTSALIAAIARNWFADTSYRTYYNDPFFEDEREMGAILQVISAEVPAVQESHAWQTFVSGTSTAGSYTLYLPTVESKLFGRSVSWELPITVTDEQWDDAFRTADDLAKFVSYLFVCVDNAITCHIENMNEMNRNNFIAEKLLAEADPNVPGVHVINLLTNYNTDRGGTIASVADFLADPDALRYAASTIDEYSTYFRKMSSMFNTEAKPRFTPDERKVVQVLKKFAKAIQEVSLSGAFNAQYVELPGYEEVPFWQGFGTSISWSDVSSIDVNVNDPNSPDHVTQSGIVALVVDKWAIIHTIRSHRVAVQRFDPEACTEYFYQFRDSYCNNLGMNGLVFILAK